MWESKRERKRERKTGLAARRSVTRPTAGEERGTRREHELIRVVMSQKKR
jgi:hypothetical protein